MDLFRDWLGFVGLIREYSLWLQIMWAEAMGKLEGMDSLDRERLWPQLIQGFKDLSHRLKVRNKGYNSIEIWAPCLLN